MILAFVVLSRLLLGSVSTWVSTRALGRLCCVASLSRGRFGFLRGKLCSSSHVGSHALLCDVTALARSWTSPDGWLRGERPADRRALEGAVAKAGSVASRSSRESRVSRESRERTRTQRVVLNCPGLDIAHRRLAQSERRYGTEPRLHGCSCKALSCDEKNYFLPLY